MTQDKFEMICENLVKKFTLLDDGIETLEDPKGQIVWKIFELPEKRIKLSLKTTPKFEGEKITSAKRIGAEASIEKTYSDSEFVNTLKIEQADSKEDNWQEVRSEDFKLV